MSVQRHLLRRACISIVFCVSTAASIRAQTLEWVKPSLVGEPSARCCASVAYDASMQVALLFGGRAGGDDQIFFADTWTFSRTAGWTQLSPSSSPPELAGAGIAYDRVTNTVVLFGGNSPSGTTNQTWIWDGANWTQVFPPVSPPARGFNEANSMVFDPVLGQVVLFGGALTDSVFLSDTWLWDGMTRTWTEQFPAHHPSPRTASLAFDEAQRRVVLFGGNSSGFALYNDTWTYNGLDWKQQEPTTSPSARCDNGLSYYPLFKSVVLFGGLNGACEDCGSGRLSDTWLWDGSNWKQVQTTFTPSPRSAPAFAFDPALNAALLFGGWTTDTEFKSSTWLFGIMDQVDQNVVTSGSLPTH